MPDILIKHIDNELAERIKTLSRERNWSINDVILHLLRHGVGMEHGELPFIQSADIAHLGGTWDAGESQAFKDAMSALDNAPEGFFAHLDESGKEE